MANTYTKTFKFDHKSIKLQVHPDGIPGYCSTNDLTKPCMCILESKDDSPEIHHTHLPIDETIAFLSAIGRGEVKSEKSY